MLKDFVILSWGGIHLDQMPPFCMLLVLMTCTNKKSDIITQYVLSSCCGLLWAQHNISVLWPTNNRKLKSKTVAVGSSCIQLGRKGESIDLSTYFPCLSQLNIHCSSIAAQGNINYDTWFRDAIRIMICLYRVNQCLDLQFVYDRISTVTQSPQ